jgi:recombination protein RecA
VIEKRGSFYNYGDLRLAQGRENAKTFLRENPETADEIEIKIREQYGLAGSEQFSQADSDQIEQVEDELPLDE